jgi:hypothetical protein
MGFAPDFTGISPAWRPSRSHGCRVGSEGNVSRLTKGNDAGSRLQFPTKFEFVMTNFATQKIGPLGQKPLSLQPVGQVNINNRTREGLQYPALPPALCPAFKVRRGRRHTSATMRRHAAPIPRTCPCDFRAACRSTGKRSKVRLRSWAETSTPLGLRLATRPTIDRTSSLSNWAIDDRDLQAQRIRIPSFRPEEGRGASPAVRHSGPRAAVSPPPSLTMSAPSSRAPL